MAVIKNFMVLAALAQAADPITLKWNASIRQASNGDCFMSIIKDELEVAKSTCNPNNVGDNQNSEITFNNVMTTDDFAVGL